jgi:hypothetical protein
MGTDNAIALLIKVLVLVVVLALIVWFVRAVL